MNGTVVSTGQYNSIGTWLFETATMNVQGTGRFTATGDLNVGDTGNSTDSATGTLNISDSANVTINSTGGFFVGSGYFANTMATGTVNQSGGTLTANGNFDGAFIVGGRQSSLATGTYNLSGGAVIANTNVQIGGFGTGTVNQTGGIFQSNQFISIGRWAALPARTTSAAARWMKRTLRTRSLSAKSARER